MVDEAVVHWSLMAWLMTAEKGDSFGSIQWWSGNSHYILYVTCSSHCESPSLLWVNPTLGVSDKNMFRRRLFRAIQDLTQHVCHSIHTALR